MPIAGRVLLIPIHWLPGLWKGLRKRINKMNGWNTKLCPDYGNCEDCWDLHEEQLIGLTSAQLYAESVYQFAGMKYVPLDW